MIKLIDLLREIKVNNPVNIFYILTSPENLESTLSSIGYHWGTYGNLHGYFEELEKDYPKVEYQEIRKAVEKIEEKYKDQIEEWTDEDMQNYNDEDED